MKSGDYDKRFEKALTVIAVAVLLVSAIDGGLYAAGKNGVYVLVAYLALHSVRRRIARVLRITLEDE